MSSIKKFKSKVTNDFARSNLFRCEITFPSGTKKTKADTEIEFFIRAAQIPSSTIGVIEIPFQGRTYKIPGDRTFEPWTITVMSDAKMGLRKSFEAWVNKINNAQKNRSQFAGLDYLQNMKVELLARAGKNADGRSKMVVRKYKFFNAYPTNVSSIDLDANANDAISEFTVEMQYSYWDLLGNSSDLPEIMNKTDITGLKATMPTL